jgi:hypothetical protein
MKIIGAIFLTAFTVSLILKWIATKARYYDAWTDIMLRSKAKGDDLRY